MPDYRVSGGGLRGYLGKIRSDLGERNRRKPVFGFRLLKEGLFCKGLRSSEKVAGCNTVLVCAVRTLVIGNDCLAGALCRLRPRQIARSRPLR